MRFAFVSLIFSLATVQAFAAPGDKYDKDSEWSERPAIKRQARSNDVPTAPKGFAVAKIGSNLGEVIALTTIDSDLFVADATQDRVIRLKSRQKNSVFETRAEFLVGFNNIHDLATDETYLYMSDNDGIWEIPAGNSLIADKAPKLVYQNPSRNLGSKISLASLPGDQKLIVGNGKCVFGLNAITGETKNYACGDWQVEDVAVSPSGGIWASVVENNSANIMPIRQSMDDVVKMKLPPHAKSTDIQFWKSDKFPETWPGEWAADLLFSISGTHPMIGRAHFNFGDIETGFTSFVDGFSNPSRFVGGREYWGQPTAIAILDNGETIFGVSETGSLWVMKKDSKSSKIDRVISKKSEPVIEETETEKKKTPISLPRGSSIQSASGLETDELLKKPETIEKQTVNDPE